MTQPNQLTIKQIREAIESQLSFWMEKSQIDLNLREQIQICAEIIRLENDYNPLKRLIEGLDCIKWGQTTILGAIKIATAKTVIPPPDFTFLIPNQETEVHWFEK